MSYCIGSLNLRGGKRAERHKRDFYEFIYSIICQENFVLLAFQEDAEVRCNSVIDEILGTGNDPLSQRGWEGFHMPGSFKSSEFSFIWDSTRIRACTIPRIYSNNSRVYMFREPLCGDFATETLQRISFPYEFRLINIHIWYSGGIDSRIQECKYIKNEIYEEIQNPIPDRIRHVFTVALGDYNLDCNQCNTCCLGNNVETILNEYTTITENGYYKESYDHFSFDVIKNASVKYNVSRINILKYCIDLEFYCKNISNHVPIKLEIY